MNPIFTSHKTNLFPITIGTHHSKNVCEYNNFLMRTILKKHLETNKRQQIGTGSEPQKNV